MGLFSAVGSGVGALGKGVGSLGGGLAKSIWNSGAGGKGFLIGGAAGGIYGAVSADPRMRESRLEGALWGIGIGGVGGAIGGMAIRGGLNKIKGISAQTGGATAATAAVMRGPSPVSNRVLGNAAKLRRAMRKNPDKHLGAFSSRGQYTPGNVQAQNMPWRINRSSFADVNRGAFGNAVRRAKNWKRQIVSKLKREEKKMARTPLTFSTSRSREIEAAKRGPYKPYSSSERPIDLMNRKPYAGDQPPWGVRSDTPIYGPSLADRPLGPAAGGGVVARPIRNISGEPMVGSVDEARWAARKAQIESTRGAAAERWAKRKEQIFARQAGLNPVGGGPYPPGTPRGEGWVMPGYTPPISAAESQKAARARAVEAGANKASSLQAWASRRYSEAKSNLVDELAVGFGQDAERINALLMR